MEKESLCCLERMPHEILLKIFSYLKSIDIISISEVSKSFETICYSKELTKDVNFHLEYKFKPKHIESFLTKKPRSSIITCLNINCLYWLDKNVLRDNLPELVSLEELYILDTKLSFKMKDIAVYNKLTKMKKIALTMRGIKIAPKAISSFPKVTHLCLHIFTSSNEVQIKALELVEQLQTLEILILAEPTMFRTDWPSAPLIYDNLSKSLRKITCQPFNIQVLNETMCPSNMERYKWNGGYALEKLEENEYLRAQQVNLMQKESLSKLREFFKYFMLYSMSDSRKLQLGLETLEEIYFEDLNLLHPCDCKRYKSLVFHILFSRNTTKLKRLAIDYCMLQSTKEHENVNKKRKLFSDINILKTISDHCPYLQELELWTCMELEPDIADDLLSNIKYMKNLRKLSVNYFPKTSTGECFVEIFKGCEHLNSLRISSLYTNDNLVNSICLALLHSKSLLQFRFDIEGSLPVNRILRYLPQTVQRVFLKSCNVTSFSEMYLQCFLKERENVKFMCILIENLPIYRIKCIRKNITSFWKNSDKVVIVDNISVNSMTSYKSLKIPSVYIEETVKDKVEVSKLDMFRFTW